jgi:hypothetical protein
MISRKTALKAGKTLNAVADGSGDVLKTSFREAVRIANELMYQYYLIPRAIREEYYREELSADGIQLQDLPEERV